MERDTELSACVDFLSRRLPALALYELNLDEPVFAFRSAMLGITQGNVCERMDAAGIPYRDAIRAAAERVMAAEACLPGWSLTDWLDHALRNTANPVREHVIALLRSGEIDQR